MAKKRATKIVKQDGNQEGQQEGKQEGKHIG